MARRLPRPVDAVRVRLELSPAELRLVEDAAHACRVSVASFARLALLDAADHPERVADLAQLFERLAVGSAELPPKKPGRPKKGQK